MHILQTLRWLAFQKWLRMHYYNAYAMYTCSWLNWACVDYKLEYAKCWDLW